MDNDAKVVKALKIFLKTCKYKWDYRNVHLTDSSVGNDMIRQMLLEDKPFAVGRGGAIELRCVAEYLKNGTFGATISSQININAGVFPNDQATLKKFSEYYMKCMEEADILCLWGVGAEPRIIKHHCKNTHFTGLNALEPYYFDNPWSKSLKGKKVLLVHPFIDTIKEQYEKRELLFENKDILPEFAALECIKAVQSNAGETPKYKDWFEALDWMKSQIDSTDFDVAIIGAGAYSLPLATYVKSIGRKAIQMSGSTQILFGIKGKRWDEHPVISALYNEHWVRPSQSETPKSSDKVEGGSYW